MWNWQRYFEQLDTFSLCQSIHHHRHDHGYCPDRQLLRQVWLKGNEERQDLVKEKPGNGWKGQNKTKDPDHDHRVCQEYFSSARGMASYFRSIWGPGRILHFIPHCIWYFDQGLYLSSSYICLGRASVSQLVPSLPLDCTKWGPSENLIPLKALRNVYGWIRVQMTTHRESNSIQSTLSTGANRASYERRGKGGVYCRSGEFVLWHIEEDKRLKMRRTAAFPPIFPAPRQRN